MASLRRPGSIARCGNVFVLLGLFGGLFPHAFLSPPATLTHRAPCSTSFARLCDADWGVHSDIHGEFTSSGKVAHPQHGVRQTRRLLGHPLRYSQLHAYISIPRRMCAPLCAHAYRMLVGACNPMLRACDPPKSTSGHVLRPLDKMFNWGDSDDDGGDEFLVDFLGLVPWLRLDWAPVRLDLSCLRRGLCSDRCHTHALSTAHVWPCGPSLSPLFFGFTRRA